MRPFWPDFGSKTDNRLQRQSGWQLSKIPNINLDPVYWTNVLLSLTRSRRCAGGNCVNSLFISTRGRVRPTSRSIIAGWLKTTFSTLNISFPPGSIRSAVASSRRDNNVPLDIILRNGNWRSDRNVIKHYFKEIISIPTKNDSVDNLVNSSFNTI